MRGEDRVNDAVNNDNSLNNVLKKSEGRDVFFGKGNFLTVIEWAHWSLTLPGRMLDLVYGQSW